LPPSVSYLLRSESSSRRCYARITSHTDWVKVSSPSSIVSTKRVPLNCSINTQREHMAWLFVERRSFADYIPVLILCLSVILPLSIQLWPRRRCNILARVPHSTKSMRSVKRVTVRTEPAAQALSAVFGDHCGTLPRWSMS
jgi:hypothetical protein